MSLLGLLHRIAVGEHKATAGTTTGSGSGRNGIPQVVEGVTQVVTVGFKRASSAAANKRARSPARPLTNAGAICGANAGSSQSLSSDSTRAANRRRSLVLRRQSSVDATGRHRAGFTVAEKRAQAGVVRRRVRCEEKDKVAGPND